MHSDVILVYSYKEKQYAVCQSVALHIIYVYDTACQRSCLIIIIVETDHCKLVSY